MSEVMLGQMMDTQLTLSSVMRFAQRTYGNTNIISVTPDNPRHRYTYKEAFKRVGKLANALRKLGNSTSDRIATLAWNDYRHFELYYAISCSGSICHTINPRLFPEQIEFIINNAEDKLLFTAPEFVPLLEKLKGKINCVKQIIVLTNEAHMPKSDSLELICYETLIADQDEHYDWPELDENTASSLCYTSGTTGNPKGVLYSHRSTILHAYGAALTTAFNISPNDKLLVTVPMFHVNAWAMPYSAPIVGTPLVLPGNKMGDGAELTALINEEHVTVSAGVPTVWLMVLNHLTASGDTVESLKRIVVGGAACPLAIMKAFEEDYGVDVRTAWGMTEMSPLGTLNLVKPELSDLAKDDYYALKLKQGLACYGVDMRIVDDEQNELPWDGESFGRLQVKGPWICSRYFGTDDNNAHTHDGWLDTGDIATLDEHGYMHITDRAKDVIKSGGEWISSIDLENAALNHSSIKEAAVIAAPHPKWDERPLLLVVLHENEAFDKQGILQQLGKAVAKWWLPDEIIEIEEIPHTATGKIDKKVLRQRFETVYL